MNKTKTIFSIFTVIFFTNSSFAMDDLANQLNGLAIDEENWDKIRQEYKSQLRDDLDDLSLITLPEMTPEQEARANAGQGARRRLLF